VRTLVAILTVGALLASAVWTAALPPSVVAMRACAASTVSPGPYPKRATDPMGRELALPAVPKRVVSLSISSDEILIDIARPERIAGITIYVDDPSSSAAAARAPKGTPRVNGEPEALLALGPDLVLSSAYTKPETLSILEGAGIPVIGTGTHATFTDVVRAITTIGDAIGEPDRARALAEETQARIDAVAARAEGRRKSRVLIWEGSYTYGHGTLEDDMIRVAGGVNAAGRLNGATSLTEEAAVALDPDVIIVPIDGDALVRESPSLLGSAPIWGAVRAVRKGAVAGVPRPWMNSTTHYAVRALEAIDAVLEWGGA
jgi:iron complex transport system substrate-binding protein